MNFLFSYPLQPVRQTANAFVSFGRIRTFLCLPESALDSKTSPLFKDKSRISIKNFSGTYDHIEERKNHFGNGISNDGFLMDDGKNAVAGLNGGDRKPVERLQTKEFIDCEKSSHVVNCVNGFCKDINKCKIKPSSSLPDHKLVLKNIDFECVPGDLVTIVGPVGSGKTSILMAILNEVNCVQGSISVVGRVSFACQEAWVFAG